MMRTHPQDDGNNNDHKHQDPTKTRWFHQELFAPNNNNTRRRRRRRMSLLKIVVVVVVVIPTPIGRVHQSRQHPIHLKFRYGWTWTRFAIC
jgi:hypothetical protein